MKYVFEVSWEVCNKVGGIYTVLATKASEALKNYGEGYIVLGPDLGQNSDFEEKNDSFFDGIKAALNRANISCRFGRWKLPGNPRAILVGGFKERYNIERLLYAYWNEFGADSYEASWDYLEPVIFSTCCAEVIEAICKNLLQENDHAVAHFHEWMCGAGLLYLKKNMNSIGTVFTTHATMLGRSMAHHNQFYYHEIEMANNVSANAYKYGVKAKHSMEAVTAKNADCFTTVSEITARECYMILGRDPDLLVYNGMDVQEPIVIDKAKRSEKRKYLLKICESFVGEKIPEDTQIWLSSGRYEFKNKGYDLSIDALARLKNDLGKNCPNILMLFLVAADNSKVKDYALPKSSEPNLREIAISPVYEKPHDAIINACKYHGLDQKDSPIKVVFSTLYLDGEDGIFNMKYEDILETCDLSLFPSFYEPWGYTPLESAVLGIPTVTSDLSGFGYWTQINEENFENLIMVLPRRNKTFEEASCRLAKLFEKFCAHKCDKKIIEEQTNKLRSQIDWSKIYPDYKNAYDIAFGKGYDRQLASRPLEKNPFSGARCHIQPGKPILRCFSLDVSLPDRINKLNEIAYNVWWSWDDDAQELFRSLNPDLWEYYDRNPIRLLKSIAPSDLDNLKSNLAFVEHLDRVYSKFKNYMGDVSSASLIDISRPSIAYLSMEFGLHESLPIYSGGLGILAGDHLKSASDMNLNMIGIGLFYKNGYFVQEINHEGYQIEHYPEFDWSGLPVNVLLNQSGESVKIPVDFPDHVVWAKVLVVRVGRVPLFLLDTNIEENRPEDRRITDKLYVGDRESRIKQEILIGIAGVRLLKDVLGLDPAVYHLNEGHCAFIAVELLRRYALQGYSFDSAIKAIQGHTIFTTHTPVAAGNEAFAIDLVRAMLFRIFDYMHFSLDQFINLGRNINNSEEFSMTVLALRISRKANSVSKLHEDVSREMWSSIFPAGDSNFFNFVTNGVHMPTWFASRLKQLCKHGDYLDFDKIHQAPNELVWNLHQEHKKDLITYLKDQIKRQYLRRGLGIEEIKKLLEKLDQQCLLIGFARRFAEYKRASLLFRDPGRLEKILNNTDQPVVIVYGGKSHPANGVAKELIKEIYQYVLDERFIGKLLIIENYNMHTGRLLTSGVDLWLNNPIMRQEACGTSGMKAAASGVLNLSLPDGWWAEGYRADLGWKIQPGDLSDYEKMCDQESRSLYDLLENEVIPLYYSRNQEGYSDKWVEKMKISIAETGRHFSANRMLEDYNTKMYIPVIKRSLLTASEQA